MSEDEVKNKFKVSQADFYEFTQHIQEMVEKQIAEHPKALMPVAFVKTVDVLGEMGMIVAAMPEADFNDSDVKQECMKAVGKRLFDDHLFPLIVSMASEAWVSTCTKDELGKHTRPSEDPNRKEVIVIAARDMLRNHTRTIIIPISRDENEKISASGEPDGHDEAETYLLDDIIEEYKNYGLQQMAGG